MRAVVVASGDLVPGDLRHLDGADLVIAADGGAAALERAGCRIDRLVGDLDSADPLLVERLGRSGTEVTQYPADKDASDTELAVEAALDAGASEVMLLGALGGERLDHELANVLLLADPVLGPPLRIARGTSLARAVRDGRRLDIVAGPGSLVTLLPIGAEVTGITTVGLRWTLEDATLPMGRSRGLSNEVLEAGASVQLGRGTLLVVETIIEGVNRS
ncbi:MAG: thiamine diphosphokinase [Chloroflexi bacterium]|nr:thiamine diphosphokinase [Chloroflexota bacterium]